MRQKPEIAKYELGFRLNYDDLAEIMEVLFNKFVGTGEAKDHPQVAEMRRRANSAAWHNVLTLAGWSESEFEAITLERLDHKELISLSALDENYGGNLTPFGKQS